MFCSRFCNKTLKNRRNLEKYYVQPPYFSNFEASGFKLSAAYAPFFLNSESLIPEMHMVKRINWSTMKSTGPEVIFHLRTL